MSDVKNECPNCGYDWSKNEKYCKYCGTSNPTFVEPKKAPTFNFLQPNNTNDSNEEKSNDGNNVSQTKFSVVAFIILLIFFWPAAIIYLLLTMKK